MSDTNAKIKERFGKALREARDNKKYSRASLATRLGISQKTIQSWEMGRSFIEQLALIPEIENELGISISRLIETSINGDTENALPPLVEGLARKGPITPTFTIQSSLEEVAALMEKDANANWVAVPVVSGDLILNEVPDLYLKDVERHILIPMAWKPRGGVLIATRMNDSGMEPRMFLDDMLIVDCRPTPPEKNIGKILAFNLKDHGLRFRQLYLDKENQRMIAGGCDNMLSRKHYQFHPDKGSLIVGRVVGILSPT